MLQKLTIHIEYVLIVAKQVTQVAAYATMRTSHLGYPSLDERVVDIRQLYIFYIPRNNA